jgi:hypothetical protein
MVQRTIDDVFPAIVVDSPRVPLLASDRATPQKHYRDAVTIAIALKPMSSIAGIVINWHIGGREHSDRPSLYVSPDGLF